MSSLKSNEHAILPDGPQDDITCVSFSPGPSPDILAVSSWDNTVILYDMRELRISAKYSHTGPVLSLCFPDSHHTVSGGVDCAVIEYDIPMGQTRELGRHTRPISVIHHNKQHEMLLTGSWDQTVCHFDPQSPSPVPIKSLNHPERVIAMDSSGDNLVVGMIDRLIWWWDLRNLREPVEKRESTLKYPTKCMRCFPNHQGYLLGSIEGRVSLEVFNMQDISKKYAFKCHRVKQENKEIVYPVTALAIHPTYNTFATGGCDATVAIWDGENKKRLIQFPKFPAAIASLAFSDDGQLLAIASSYMWEKGEVGDSDKPKPSITVRCVADSEIRPKHLVSKP